LSKTTHISVSCCGLKPYWLSMVATNGGIQDEMRDSENCLEIP